MSLTSGTITTTDPKWKPDNWSYGLGAALLFISLLWQSHSVWRRPGQRWSHVPSALIFPLLSMSERRLSTPLICDMRSHCLLVVSVRRTNCPLIVVQASAPRTTVRSYWKFLFGSRTPWLPILSVYFDIVSFRDWPLPFDWWTRVQSPAWLHQNCSLKGALLQCHACACPQNEGKCCHEGHLTKK